MRYKLLFLDTNHSLSAIAAYLAQDYSNENVEIASAGLYNEALPEMTRTALDRMHIPAFDRVTFESISEQTFDLVVVLGLYFAAVPAFPGCSTCYPLENN